MCVGGMNMMQVDMLQAKIDLSKLIELLENNQEEVIYLTDNGEPVVQMTLIKKTKNIKRIGVAEGKFKIPEEFDSWDSEVEEMFA